MQKIAVSAELALLIEAILSPEYKPVASESPPHVNWEVLIRLASRHQVRPLLLDFIESTDLLSVPEKQLQTLKTYSVGQAVTNMVFLKISLSLYNALMECGTSAFLMKGAIWAWMIYEKPGSREFGDVDFFVAKADVSKSVKVMAEKGFEPDPYRTYLLKEKKIARLYFETDYQLPLSPVHDHPLQSLEIQWNATYPRYCYPFEWDELARDMVEFQVMNSSIKIPRMENQVLMMIVHHAGVEQWDKLKYLADFVRLLRKYADRMDWAYIVRISKSKGFYNLLAESLQLVFLTTDEDYSSYTGIEQNNFHQQPRFIKEVIRHWENERPVVKTKSWRIFRHNFIYRDSWNVKLQLIWKHITYFTQFQLIWYKARWYSRSRTRQD